ncbi:OPT oligopeptide transporter protein-domain-containing protein [Kockiozyma suomiensis]|uniref:OPT oligopeptide transporter protein-domain-containing protein n=1 Tax=Kockiozyma suomiensis TaxID=1337062 RepID=UPI003343D3A1
MNDFIEKKGNVVTVEREVLEKPNFSSEKNGFVTESSQSISLTAEEREKFLNRIMESKELEDIGASDLQLEYLLSKLHILSLDECIAEIKEAASYHRDDYNYPIETRSKISRLLKGPMEYGLGQELYEIDLRLEATLNKFNSPYPEVRAVTDPTDDFFAPVETPRAYFLGLFWVVVGSFINEVFLTRQPSLSIKSAVFQILVYPGGKLLERIVPNKTYYFRGRKLALNPGPWSYKEQMFATIMINAGANFANIENHTLVYKLPQFFAQTWVNFGFMLVANVSTQFFGFGVAGILRRWVIYEKKAVWPTILPTLTLNRVLLQPEEKHKIHGWSISRYRFFWYTLAGAFVYFWLPDFLFTALSTFNWITWIAPKNKILALITGSKTGMGFNPIPSFDWTVINYSGPLTKPFFASANQYAGVMFGAFLIIGMVWKNYKWTGYLPMNTSTVYANNGLKYNMSRITNKNDRLDVEAYRAYSAPYFTAGNLLREGSSYCMVTLSFTSILLSDYKLLWTSMKGFFRALKNWRKNKLTGTSSFDDFDDPMSLMIREYEEVPDWWFFVILIVSLVFGIILFEVYPIVASIWVLFAVFGISLLLLIPSTVIYSVTGYQVAFNDLMVVLGGYFVPGSGIGNIIGRLYGWNIDEQAESFVSDLKLAHYAKLPPRAVFRGQVIATAVNCLVTVGGVNVVLGLNRICYNDQPDKFVCAYPNSIYNTSLFYGLVGPDRVFSMYPGLKYCFLAGVLIGIVYHPLQRYFPRIFRTIHPVVILSGVYVYGQSYNLSYYTMGFWFALFFMYYVRKRYLNWWTKYVYVLTSGLTAGTAFAAIIIFGSISYTGTSVKWWGTTVSTAGIDAVATTTLFDIPESGTFGLQVGEFQ